jgi:predicted alpha/beta-hydrolase family hydrolase
MDSSMDGARRIEQQGVRGWLHLPAGTPVGGLGLTHGAGSNCGAALLVGVAEAFAAHGVAVLRYDLAFRQARPQGPPTGSQARDRDSIRNAAAALRELAPGVPVYLAGHSYGGRQTTMLAAEDGDVADALLLLSYPLHPPGQPEKLRTEHFGQLRTPALFVHGTRDEFGTLTEMEAALCLAPARTELRSVTGGHGLHGKFAAQIAEWFVTFTSK